MAAVHGCAPPGGYFLRLAPMARPTAIAPAAGLLGHWPSYSSFASYSENTKEASVAMEGGRADVRTLAYEQVNVPAYPARTVYLAVGEKACETEQPSTPALVVRGAPEVLSGSRDHRKYTCGELLASP